MMPLWLLGSIAFTAIAFMDISHSTGSAHVSDADPVEDKGSPSAMLSKIQNDEVWDANYLLGCHAQKDVVKLHFCYETISGKTIEAFYEAFRHGNTLLSRHMENPDDLILEAAGIVVNRGLSNYNKLRSICAVGDCSEDVAEYVHENEKFAISLKRKAESQSAL